MSMAICDRYDIRIQERNVALFKASRIRQSFLAHSQSWSDESTALSYKGYIFLMFAF